MALGQDKKQNHENKNIGQDKTTGFLESGFRFLRRFFREVQGNRRLTFVIFVIGVVVLLFAVMQMRTQHEYDISDIAENEDTQSSNYAQLGDYLLKYGDDSVSLLSHSQSVLWNQTYEMGNPDANVQGNYAVIYDKRGTQMYVVRRENPVGPIETRYPILKARVTALGTVAAILEDGEKTWINYYASDGSVIAENQTRMENPGYPLDLAVSSQGGLIAVSYAYVEDGSISSRVVYYNFADAGQTKVDNIVAEFTYENTLVPQIIYMNNRTSVLLRDDGFSIIEGEETPVERENKELDSEIVSTFYNDSYFGVVLKGEEDRDLYEMEVYTPSGRRKCRVGFDLEYQNIGISRDRIILYNGEQVWMYNLNGILKFDGMLEEGAVKNLFQVAANRYILVSENGISTIRLK